MENDPRSAYELAENYFNYQEYTDRLFYEYQRQQPFFDTSNESDTDGTSWESASSYRGGMEKPHYYTRKKIRGIKQRNTKKKQPKASQVRQFRKYVLPENAELQELPARAKAEFGVYQEDGLGFGTKASEKETPIMKTSHMEQRSGASKLSNIRSSILAALASVKQRTERLGMPKKIKTVADLPPKASMYHPGVLFSYMRPQIAYQDLGLSGDYLNLEFVAGLRTDGCYFFGKGRSKKLARKAAAKEACKGLFGLVYEGSGWWSDV